MAELPHVTRQQSKRASERIEFGMQDGTHLSAPIPWHEAERVDMAAEAIEKLLNTGWQSMVLSEPAPQIKGASPVEASSRRRRAGRLSLPTSVRYFSRVQTAAQAPREGLSMVVVLLALIAVVALIGALSGRLPWGTVLVFALVVALVAGALTFVRTGSVTRRGRSHGVRRGSTRR